MYAQFVTIDIFRIGKTKQTIDNIASYAYR